MTPAIRINGTSDSISLDMLKGTDGKTLLEKHPDVQFYDYTKNPHRMDKFAEGRMPGNYHLTFSRSEENDPTSPNFKPGRGNVEDVLKKGGGVAIVCERPPGVLDAGALLEVSLLAHTRGAPLHTLRHPAVVRLTVTSRLARRIGVGPKDDDQHAVAVRRPAEDGGGTRRGDDARVHLLAVAFEEAHPHPRALHLVGRHFEPAPARDGKPLWRSERAVDAVAFQRGVVVVAEDHPQLEALPPARRRAVRAVCVDMWEPFRLSLQAHLPHAKIVYDKFHVEVGRCRSEGVERTPAREDEIEDAVPGGALGRRADAVAEECAAPISMFTQSDDGLRQVRGNQRGSSVHQADADDNPDEEVQMRISHPLTAGSPCWTTE